MFEHLNTLHPAWRFGLPCLFLALVCMPAPGLAQELGDGFQPNILPALDIPRSSGSIRIDGELDDPGWSRAARARNFVETSPGDQVPPPVQTEVLVTYDEEHFYLAFIAEDDPALVRASLRDRDEIFQDDYVGILFDTYGDQSWAYELFCNPLGIQGDLRLVPGADEDMGFDLVWESKGRITEHGFQVEIAVPFSSLRFPDSEVQEWRATFWRDRKRNFRERSSWASIDRDDPCFLCQFGTLRGIRDVEPGNKLELLPSTIGYQTGALADAGDPDSEFLTEDLRGEFGLSMQYSFSPSLSAEAAVNPDFSQVESDAAQIDINTPFALFYPERRPFFQRGSNLFGSWINLIYTRSINNPLFASKLTARRGNTSLLYLAAYDEDSPYILPFEEGSVFLLGGESVSNILRARHSFSGGSFIGGLLTDRRMRDGGAGSVGGIDFAIRFRNSYLFEFQGVASRTEEPDDGALTEGLESITFDDGAHTAVFDGEDFWGHSYYASLERNGRVWSCDFDYRETSPRFRSDNGFITANNRRNAFLWTGWNHRVNTELVDNVFPMLIWGAIWNFDGERKDHFIQPQLEFNLAKQTWLQISQMWSSEVFGGVEFDGIRRSQVRMHTGFSDPLQFGGSLGYARTIRRTDDPFLGKQLEISTWATIKPLQRLIVQPEYAFLRMRHPDDDSIIFSGYILRTRLKYQFTRRLFLRTVLQYNDFAQDFDVEPLLSYKLNPFTVFYAGSTHHLINYDGEGKVQESARQYFVKIQYLFQS